MPDEGVSTGELSRQVRDVLIRFQGLADRLDSSYVSKELYQLRQEVLDRIIRGIEDSLSKTCSAETVKAIEAEKASVAALDDLRKRVDTLEDDKKWLTRLVAAFIILGVLGAVFVASGVYPK